MRTIFLCTLIACGGVPPPEVKTRLAPPTLAHELDEYCSDCHTAEAGRPDFSPNKQLERGTVLEILSAVASDRMPPKHQFPISSRTAVIRAACAAVTTRTDQCVDSYVTPATYVLTHSPDIYFRMVDRFAPPLDNSPPLRGMLDSDSKEMSPTWALIQVLTAQQRCGPLLAKDAAAFASCVDRVFSPALTSPQPAHK
jgi:hypothetical protein